MKMPRPYSSSDFLFDLHWTSQDLADAVPLRLSETPVFQVDRHAEPCANAASLQRARRTSSFLPGFSMPAVSTPIFRTR